MVGGCGALDVHFSILAQAVRGGKLHLPTGRGRPADRHHVYFTTAAALAAKCPKAALEGRWKTCMRFFAGPRLLIVDEFGYLSLPEDGASALFQVIAQRYLKSSTILTTNVGIADWAGAFGDATVAAAMLDRLPHRAASPALTDPPTDFTAIKTRPTPYARESTHVSPDPHPQRRTAHPQTTAHSARTSSCRARARSTALPRCKSAAHRRAPASLDSHTCPICDGIFTVNPRLRQDYCSPECRRESERQRILTRDEERARRLDEHPRALPPAPQPTAPGTIDPLARTFVRNCPRCDQPVTIVALLATQEAARPTITNRVTDIVPLRRLQ
ncbi:ATP-binding protein [Streptomyces sp. NPDC005499]|uniref:ATP-binding protein n=1 Tax=Streptomyces sp. NPDC005499 TaxID=3154883 RepID=UPI00339E2F68